MIDLEIFFHKQVHEWGLAQRNYADLVRVEKKGFSFGEFDVWTHFIPSRITSASAQTDKEHLRARPCPLCREHLPPEQIVRPWGGTYRVALNPYPILPRHFTVMDEEHVPQTLAYQSASMIRFAKEQPRYVVLYNGPKSGASIPDHYHFQAVPKGYLPVERDVFHVQKTEMFQDKEGKVFYLRNYLRDCFVLESSSEEWTQYWIESKLWQELGLSSSRITPEHEPMMNLVFSYEPSEDTIRTFVFPRRKHRPDQYYEEGNAQLMVSPGTIDMAGILITPRKQDFEKITQRTITDIYKQVSFQQ